MIFGVTVYEKNAMITYKIKSCTIVQINNFEILKVIIAFLSDTLRPTKLKFFFYINRYGYSMQTKFNVTRSHSFREKCDDYLKIASHFSTILCDRGTWNLDCVECPYGLIYKKNFKFFGRTVLEKSAMLISSYHLIFLQNCATEEHEI